MQAPVLLTGFGPFREFAVNSSWEGVRLVAESMPGIVRAGCLSVHHVRAHEELCALLEEVQPRIALCVGLASNAGEGELRLEERARKPEELAHRDGPAELEGAWPWSEMEAQLTGFGGPVRRSRDAGRYVCESTYWSLLDYRRRNGRPQWAAFLHVAPLSAGFQAEAIAGALRSVLQARLARA